MIKITMLMLENKIGLPYHSFDCTLFIFMQI